MKVYIRILLIVIIALCEENIWAQWPQDKVFIVTSSSKGVSLSQWEKSMGAIAIALNTPKVQVRIALNNLAGKKMMWGASGMVSGVSTTVANKSNSAPGDAIGDMKGKENTYNEVTQLHSSIHPGTALSLIKSYKFRDGVQGYIPSLGQMTELFNNLDEVNRALVMVGGTVIEKDWYWTSTQHYSNYRIWAYGGDASGSRCFAQLRNNNNNYSKKYGAPLIYVRPFGDLYDGEDKIRLMSNSNETIKMDISEEFVLKKRGGKPQMFYITMYGLSSDHAVGYDYNNYDLTPIIKKYEQKGEKSQMILSTFIKPELGFSEKATKLLSSKIDDVRLSVDSRTSNNKRFLITAKMDTLNIDVITSDSVWFQGVLTLYILDSVNKTIYCKCSINDLSGYGKNSDIAIENSIAILDERHNDIEFFIRRGLKNINIYYENLMSQDLYDIVSAYIPLRFIGYEEKDYEYDKIEKAFDNAVEHLLSVPKDHALYSRSINYAAYIAYIKSEYHYRFVLRQASRYVGWENPQTGKDKNNKKAISLLDEIPKESQFYNEALHLKSEAKRNLMSVQEQLNEVAQMGEDAYLGMLDKNERVKSKVQVQSNTASGLFTLGVLALAAAMWTPPAAPIAIIRIILL